jgi:GDP-L-fucose synthase
MDKLSRIFISGHTGLVGSAIHRCLISRGYENFILSPISELDLTRQKDVEAFFEETSPEYVIDAAAKVGGIMANDTYRAEFIYDNLMIQNNLIHSSYKYGVKKLLFLGSSCIYPKNAPQPLKEEYLLTGELEPTNEPYAIAKIAGIKMCESYYRQYGCNFISVMPTNLYGLNDNYNLETSHVLPAIIRKMHLGKCLENNDWQSLRKDLEKRPVEGVGGSASEKEILEKLNKYGVSVRPSSHSASVTLWGTGNVYREFLHVDDMASACVFLMENIDISDLIKISSPSGPGNQYITFLNIGTGEDLTIGNVAEIIKKIAAFKGEIIWDHTKPDGTYKKQLDVSKLRSIGFINKYSLEEGIEKVYRDYLED